MIGHRRRRGHKDGEGLNNREPVDSDPDSDSDENHGENVHGCTGWAGWIWVLWREEISLKRGSTGTVDLRDGKSGLAAEGTGMG